MDYGKLAYAKTQELSRRISALSSSFTGQKTLCKALYGVTAGSAGAILYFNALSRAEVTVMLYGSALCGEDFEGEGAITVNGYAAAPFPLTLYKNAPTFFCASKRVTVEEGSAEISIEINGAESVTFNSLMFCACGDKITYADVDVKTLFASGANADCFGALLGTTLQVFWGKGESALQSAPKLYSFETIVENAKLFLSAAGLNCVYLSRGKLFYALLGHEENVAGKEICGSVSSFDYVEYQGVRYVYAVIRAETYLIKLNAQFEPVSQQRLYLGNKISAIKCSLWGDLILLAAQEQNAVKLYLSLQGGYQAVGALAAKGLTDLKSGGGALLTKDKGLLYLHLLDGEFNTSSLPLFYCENACFADGEIMFSEENQISLKNI